MKIFPISTENYYYEHLFDSKENIKQIDDFFIDRESGRGLERYLKNLSFYEEDSDSSRTYLVKDKDTKESVAFFTLKAGLFTVKVDDEYFNNISAVELSDFAVNSHYRLKHPGENRIGKNVFFKFIIPLVPVSKVNNLSCRT